MDYKTMMQTAEAVKEVMLRDVFAGQALQGILAADGYNQAYKALKDTSKTERNIAIFAYELADAMMAARKRGF